MTLSRRFPRPETSTTTSDDGSDNTDKSKEWTVSSVRLLRCGAFMICASVICLMSLDQPQDYNIVTLTNILQKASSIPKAADLRAEAIKKYENCSISFLPPPPRKEADWRKPLWVPAMSGSGAFSPSKKGDVVKALIDNFTGLKAGTKNYHMSVKNKLRRCKGMSETAACTQAHPYVPVGPENQKENFQPPVIFAIRNVATAFPAGHNDKAAAYHGATGQVSEDEWRQMRDEYLKIVLRKWKEMILWWRNADYYKIAMYVPFEKMMDVETGPPLVQRLANQFQKAGFDVAPAQDIPCIWYKSVKREWARQKELMKYVPGYTKEQRDFILQELEQFMKEVQDDEELTEILKDYHTEVRDNTRIDENKNTSR